MEQDHLTPLEQALQKAGSQVRLAEICEVTQPTVWGWLNTKAKRLPAEHVLKVAKALDIPASVLRPDIYPAERAA